MQRHEVDLLIDRARRAWLRRPECNGRAPIIRDSDVEFRKGRDVVVLRDGDAVIAEYLVMRSGELRFKQTKH